LFIPGFYQLARDQSDRLLACMFHEAGPVAADGIFSLV